jgi:hypothetical protein
MIHHNPIGHRSTRSDYLPTPDDSGDAVEGVIYDTAPVVFLAELITQKPHLRHASNFKVMIKSENA